MKKKQRKKEKETKEKQNISFEEEEEKKTFAKGGTPSSRPHLHKEGAKIKTKIEANFVRHPTRSAQNFVKNPFIEKSFQNFE